jgi:hypothetical protein
MKTKYEYWKSEKIPKEFRNNEKFFQQKFKTEIEKLLSSLWANSCDVNM